MIYRRWSVFQNINVVYYTRSLDRTRVQAFTTVRTIAVILGVRLYDAGFAIEWEIPRPSLLSGTD